MFKCTEMENLHESMKCSKQSNLSAVGGGGRKACEVEACM